LEALADFHLPRFILFFGVKSTRMRILTASAKVRGQNETGFGFGIFSSLKANADYPYVGFAAG
jgi:hypothetical protein